MPLPRRVRTRRAARSQQVVVSYSYGRLSAFAADGDAILSRRGGNADVRRLGELLDRFHRACRTVSAASGGCHEQAVGSLGSGRAARGCRRQPKSRVVGPLISAARNGETPDVSYSFCSGRARRHDRRCQIASGEWPPIGNALATCRLSVLAPKRSEPGDAESARSRLQPNGACAPDGPCDRVAVALGSFGDAV